MHVLKRVVGFVRAVIGFAVRRRRLSVAVVVALLLVMPLAPHRGRRGLRAERDRPRHRGVDSQAARAVRWRQKTQR